MDFTTITKDKRWLIPVILIIFMGVAFFIRAVPVLSVNSQGFLPIFDTDTWYNLRQIEVMVNHFPQYNWFDPMTAFPYGKVIDWGPLFPTLAAILCLMTGSTTHESIIFMSGWLSPLIGMAMVPLMYVLGKTIWNKQAGLVSAGLISIVSYQYFFDTSYGVVDHHAAEILFSSLFILIYIWTISHMRQNPPDIKESKTFFLPILLSISAGVIWFLALISSTTVLLILMVVAVFTIIQSILDGLSPNPSEYLVIVNSIFLSTTVCLLYAFGFVRDGASFTQYSAGLVYLHLLLIAVTLVFYGLSRLFGGKRELYLGSIAIFAVISGSLLVVVPSLQTTFAQAIDLLFGSSQFSVGVQETLPWTLANALTYFSTSIILACGGILILGYSLVKKKESPWVFFAIWTATMLILTLEHQRFQYYLTVNIILLSALCISESVDARKEKITRFFGTLPSRSPNGNPIVSDEGDGRARSSRSKKGSQKPVTESRSTKSGHFGELTKNLTLVIVVILTLILIGSSFWQDYSYGATINRQGIISSDWTESLGWIESTTPSPGVDYFGQYEKNAFSYLDSSYGIMAVWDAGHWITFFSHRLPITNPFQDNLAGNDGAAAFFLSENETHANEILTSFRGKYVITNSGMAVDIFTGLVPWVNPSSDISPYIKYFLEPDPGNPSHLTKIHLYDNDYFQTEVVRLHLFDGSMTQPESAAYLQYVVRKVPAPGETSGDVNGYARVITGEKTLDISRGINDTTIISESGGLAPQRYANIFSRLPNQSVQEIPALKHYRLVHESPDDSVVLPFPESTPYSLLSVKQVKIFEFVQGAHIPGTGIIEVPVITNTGRTFVYRQESENGEFVVPYVTGGSTLDVRTTAPYHIVGTNQYFNVTEDEVTFGKPITNTHG